MKLYNIILSAICVLITCACGNRKGDDGIETPKNVYLNDSLKNITTIDYVEEENVSDDLLLNGSVTFDESKVSRVFAAFDGVITSLKVETGSYVKKGQILAVVKSSDVANYGKESVSARQAVIVAKRNLQSVEDMYKSGMASEKDVLEARRELNEAKADVKKMGDIFSMYHLNGQSYYQIKSPVSGFVVEKHANESMQVKDESEEPLFVISGLSDVWVLADVYEGDISKVAKGVKARVKVTAYPDRVFEGVVDNIYPVLDEESKTMKARIKLNNNDMSLKPGMFASVYIKGRSSDLVMPKINTNDIIFEDGKNYVVVVGKNGKLLLREITIYKNGDDFTYVSNGLKKGERVINHNSLLVYNALNDD